MRANLFIVEDEMPIVTLLKYNLEKEGHKVDYAVNGEDAIRNIKEKNPDCVNTYVCTMYVQPYVKFRLSEKATKIGV